MICESSNDIEANFRWFKVIDSDEIELTNVVGGDAIVAGGELNVNIGSLNNKDVFRCKLDDEVRPKMFHWIILATRNWNLVE